MPRWSTTTSACFLCIGRAGWRGFSRGNFIIASSYQSLSRPPFRHLKSYTDVEDVFATKTKCHGCWTNGRKGFCFFFRDCWGQIDFSLSLRQSYWWNNLSHTEFSADIHKGRALGRMLCLRFRSHLLKYPCRCQKLINGRTGHVRTSVACDTKNQLASRWRERKREREREIERKRVVSLDLTRGWQLRYFSSLPVVLHQIFV